MLHRKFRSARTVVAAGFALAVLLTAQVSAHPAFAQSPLVPNRIVSPIDENARVTLKGTVHPLANARNDRGAASDSMELDRLQITLQRSAAQESALKQLIGDLHTPGTASYHKWLTPDQFGAQFGPSDQDIATVESWLASHGFQVTKVNPGKQTIEFSGNVGQLRDTFHTQIHKYAVSGETHYANANDPQIPSALAPVIGGFVSLNNFHARRQSRVLGKATYDPKTDKATPQWTVGSASEGYSFVLSPADYAVQYDLNPLYTAGANGTGQTIAIVNDSNINVDLVNQFRTLFSLPANPPQIIIDGNDPGIDGINNPDGPNYDSVEAYLDVEWSGAVAPNATIDLVIGADTALESGLYLAAEHAVYGNIAPVLSLSFGECEAGLGSTNQFWNELWEQAAAQGITAMVSAGDNGSAGCDDDDTQDYAVFGQAVNGFGSTPYNVSVGGTDFYYSSWNQGSSAINTQLGTYWNTTPSNSAPAVSIKGVIPEQPWNDSQYGLNLLSEYELSGETITSMAAGSGGASNAAVCSTNTYDSNGDCTGSLSGYTKPSWQSGTGVPADKVRDLPDVALFASSGVNASFYPECWQDGDCQTVSSGGTVQITAIGGTSASSPSFAGIMALVNQKYGRQGQADFVLYPLATQFPASFHDVNSGNNSVPCNITTVVTSEGDIPPDNCIAVSNPITITDPTYGTATEGQIGTGTTPEYNAATGYDLASGLGTIDANQLVTNWGSVRLTSATVNLTSPTAGTSVTHGSSVTFTGTVAGTGSSEPTGAVAIETNSTEPVNQGQAFFTLSSSGAFTGSINYLPGGTYDVWASYGGDTANAPALSAKTSITVNPEASSTYFNIVDVATGLGAGVPITSGTTNIPYGTQLILDAEAVPTTFYNQCLVSANPPASCSTATFTNPTGTVVFADNGTTINTAVVNTEGDAEYNGAWSIGSHSVTAKYSGDNSYTASSGTAISFSIAKATPTILLNSALTSAGIASSFVTGQSTAITIQVENNSNATNESNYGIGYSTPVAAPTGTVTISGFPSGVPTSATLSAAVDPSSLFVDGVATIIAPSTTPAGTYTVKISYSGDANYSATSVSGTVTIAANAGLASTTTATAVGSTISPTTNITINGTVTGQSGKAAPTGGIIVYSSGNIVTEIGFSASSGDTSSFSITLNSQTLFQGANFVTLQYSGDTTYAASSTTLANPIANPLSDFSIVPETTIVPVTAASSATDTINLSSVNGFTGTPTFTCTTSTVTCTITSSATLSSGSTAPLTLTINAGSSVANGTYNVLVTGVSGSFVHTLGIEAVVTGSTSGTAGFGLTASPTTLSLAPGATTGNTSIITVTPTNSFTGDVALTYTVTGPNGAVSPPTVTFSTSPVDITGAAALTSTATLATTSTTTAGSYTITITGTSGSITETTTVTATVTAAANASFTLGSSAANAVTPGSSTTSMITVNPANGFTGTVALSCAITASPSGAVNLPGCSLSPTTTTTTSTLTVTTSASSSSTIALSRPLNRLFAVGGGIAVAGLLLFGIPARRRSWRAILGVLVFAALVSLGIGCGGSGGGGTTGTTGPTGTTAGTYTVTVTGTSGSLTATTPVTITVN